jgi:Domain of unknown function (DUF4192)
MKKRAALPRFKLKTPTDIVDAVPYLLGFQPHDSLVVLSLRGERKRVGLTARVDLPPPEHAAQCARDFVGYLTRDHAAYSIVAFYPPSDGRAHPSVQPLADALTVQLRGAGIDLVEVVCVADGRWWSLLCMNEACCPSEGTPINAVSTSACAAAMTYAGVAVLESRDELVRTIAPVTGVVRVAMDYALTRVAEELAGRVGAGLADEVARESLVMWRAEVAARLAAEVGHVMPLSVDDAARLILGLVDVRVRDQVLTWYDASRGEATRGLLVELVRRALPPFDVAPLALFAWVCYLQGNGSLAGIAIDRALAADPDYGMARLLDQALVGALDPAVFQSALRDPAMWTSTVETRPTRGRVGRASR